MTAAKPRAKRLEWKYHEYGSRLLVDASCGDLTFEVRTCRTGGATYQAHCYALSKYRSCTTLDEAKELCQEWLDAHFTAIMEVTAAGTGTALLDEVE